MHKRLCRLRSRIPGCQLHRVTTRLTTLMTRMIAGLIARLILTASVLLRRRDRREERIRKRRRMTPLKLQHLAVPVVHVEMLENMEEEHSGVTRPSSRSR
jgi:hypothetical protein